MMVGSPKVKCHQCSRLIRAARLNNDMTCKICVAATKMNGLTKGYISLEKALSRTYVIKGLVNSQGSRTCVLSLPMCLAERKIKIILVSEEVKDGK